jgi:DNA-binding MarR family transcriptional regulator
VNYLSKWCYPRQVRRQSAPTSPELDALERAVGALLRSLGGRRSGSILPAASVTLLDHLDYSGTQRVSQLAACQKIGIPAITPRLKDLQAAGLIRRGVDPSDARVSLISLSPKGRATIARIRSARCQLIADAVADLDRDSLATAADALSRIAEALQRRQGTQMSRG